MSCLFQAFCAFVLCTVIAASDTFSAESPRECVVRAGNAIDNADAELFTQNVYLDAMIAQGLEDFFAEVKKPEVARDLPPILALFLSRVQDPEQKKNIQKLLATEVRAYILDGVASGAFAGQRKQAAARGILAPLFANASTGRKELIQIGEGRSETEGWIVPCTLLDYGNGMEYPIDALVQDVDGRFKITAVRNLPEIFVRLREEAKQFNE